jgi:hypothetical protein
MVKKLMVVCAMVGGISSAVLAAEIPTFAQLDGELTKYKGRAGLEGDTNAHLEMGGVAYYCLFDMFLTVLNDPKHPKYDETKKAWDSNHDTFRKQAGLIARVMGKNLMPLLTTSSESYAKGFQEGAAQYAPGFNPADYTQPLPISVGEGENANRVAWFHGAADADGDKVTNKNELAAVAPNWLPVKDEQGLKKEGTGLGVTEEDRDRFIKEALGCESWRTRSTRVP